MIEYVLLAKFDPIIFLMIVYDSFPIALDEKICAWVSFRWQDAYIYWFMGKGFMNHWVHSWLNLSFFWMCKSHQICIGRAISCLWYNVLQSWWWQCSNVVRASTKQEQGNKCVINLNILVGQVPNQRVFFQISLDIPKLW